MDREAVTVEQLPERLRELRRQNPAVSVLVRGDAEGTFQNVANVLAVCRQAGIADMGITVRLARNTSPATR